MEASRANHAGAPHQPGRSRSGRQRTKKQFVRIRGERRIRWIHDPDDWAAVHRPGEKIQLVCPDEGCSQSMKATERTKPRTTRYLSDTGDVSCTHFLPTGGGGPKTEEHLWVQGALRKVCEELGYEARLESDYADVRVDSSPSFALEVQRVSTNFRERRAQRAERGMETIWFLPETAKKSRNDPLFTEPCVRLVYFDRSGPGAKELTPADLLGAVWTGGDVGLVDLRVAVTLWTPSQDHLEFVSAPALPIKGFLEQVLKGKHRWHPASELHGKSAPRGTWAGWALEGDLAAVQEARDEHRRQMAARRRAQEREAEEKRREEAARKVAAEHRAEATEPARENVEVKSEMPPVIEPVVEPRPTECAEQEAVSSMESGSGATKTPWWKKVWSALFG